MFLDALYDIKDFVVCFLPLLSKYVCSNSVIDNYCLPGLTNSLSDSVSHNVADRQSNTSQTDDAAPTTSTSISPHNRHMRSLLCVLSQSIG